MAVARSICLRVLSVRARSRSELEKVLARRLVPDEVSTVVLDRFVELGFVDDQAFAQAWVQSRQATKGLAGRALSYELRTKGIPDDIARAAVLAVDPEAELAKATELVRRRLATMTSLPTEVRYRRLSGMLARKGYGGAMVTTVLRDVLREQDTELASD